MHNLITRICEQCGKEYETRKPKQKYCSKKCGGEAFSDKFKGINTHGIKPNSYVCKHCGKAFTPKASDRITYCSRECSFEDKKAKPREPKEKQININICVVCSKEFEGKTKKSKCCSDECTKEYRHNEYLEYKASKQYELELSRKRDIYTPIILPIIKKICIRCNKKFETIHKSKLYCSDKCSEYLHKGNISKARKARVFKKDNYKCKLCGKKLRMDKQDTLGSKQPHLLAPTIDHVIPVSIAKQMGWTSVEIHSEANLQAAHLICNIKKSNKAMNDQLRLW